MMKRGIGFVWMLVLMATSAIPQTATDPNEGLKLTYESSDDFWDLSWWGRTNWTYFVQHSQDLQAWEYWPTIESGDGASLGYQFSNPGEDRGFLRLRIWKWSTNDPFNDDFDEDKVSNYEEVYLYGTDPLVKFDSDSDGMPDDWETKYFESSTAGVASAHDDTDTLTNLEEYDLGTNPKASDSDGDGLSDSDELNLYYLDPLNPDGDNDGLNDGAEITAGTDPTNRDSDGDGADDGADTDATDDQKYPPVWRSFQRGLTYIFYDYPVGLYQDPDGGYLQVYTSANANHSYQDLTVPLNLTLLMGYLPAFPTGPTADAYSGWRDSKTWTVDGGPPDVEICYHATLLQQRIWLCMQPAPAVDVVRTVPILVTRHINDVDSTPEVRMETVTIPAEQTHSNPIDLLPQLTVNPPLDVLYHIEWAEERKLEVEILVPDLKKESDGSEHFQFEDKKPKLKPAKQLAIGTLENSFEDWKSSKPLRADWIGEDPDSFYIRISEPALSGTGPLKARVWTDSDGTEYDDDNRSTADSEVVELYEKGTTGVFTSKSMLLMSNEADDVHSVDGIADNAKNDRTRRIALGGTVKIEFLPAGQSSTYNASAEAQVPAEKTVNIYPIVLMTGNNNRVIDVDGVAEDLKTLRETFAQCGIKIANSVTVTLHQNSVPLDLSDGMLTNANPANLTGEEQGLFDYIATNGLRTADEITLIYVNYLKQNFYPYGHASSGQSYIEKQATAPKSKNANHIIISKDDKTKFVAPHELLHILLNASHPPGPDDYAREFAHKRMTWSGATTDPGILSRKRITKRTLNRQAAKAKESTFAK